MTEMTREAAARALGMKPREVVDWDSSSSMAVLLDGTRFEFAADGSYTELPRLAAGTPVAPEPLQRVPAAEPPTPPAGEVVAAQVPEGTVAEVVAWVGRDPARAAAALDAELARPQPRLTLQAALEQVTGGAGTREGT